MTQLAGYNYAARLILECLFLVVLAYINHSMYFATKGLNFSLAFRSADFMATGLAFLARWSLRHEIASVLTI